MNIEQEIEKRAKELIKARRKLFIIKFISKSNSSICQECEDFGVPNLPFTHGERDMNWKGMTYYTNGCGFCFSFVVCVQFCRVNSISSLCINSIERPFSLVSIPLLA